MTEPNIQARDPLTDASDQLKETLRNIDALRNVPSFAPVFPEHGRFRATPRRGDP